jgi:hypothetical protein
VKKLLLLATAALVAMLILVPTAMAQEETLPQSGGQTAEPLPQSGGVVTPSVLLPAAALLVGSGIVGYALMRRR